ncbi:hypothetical protein CANARDRAFT_182015, partial [[Candida] arabinofermentans NRRL YB-2248]
LPIPQTIIQRELVELMVKLHRPNFLSILEKDENKNSEDHHDSPPTSDLEYLDDSTMLDLFVSDVKQITNHSSLLVNHYMPKNMLLLDSKENIKSSSYKYIKIDQILNRLMELKQQKTIIFNAANSRELDLIEAILIGKKNLQYYRFSGASLYYKNHGSFNFNKQQPNADSANTNGKSHANQSHNHTKNGDEYVSKISKNNPIFKRIQEEKNLKVVNVYLILSNQLSSLIEFEELKSDFIVSLDSNLKQVSSSPTIPILMPICLNSIEYFDLKLNELKSIQTTFDSSKILTYLVVANRNNVSLHENYQVDELVDWLINPQTVKYPYDLELPPMDISPTIIEQVKKSLANFKFESLYQLEKYEYFDKQLEEVVNSKRLKLEEISDLGPNVTFSSYQLKLANLIYNRFSELDATIQRGQETSDRLDHDDSKRQAHLETTVADIGTAFNKLQEAKTTSANVLKTLERSKLDLEKLTSMEDQLKERLSLYESKSAEDNDESSIKASSDELEILNKEVEDLEQKIKESSLENDEIRAKYQSESSTAAELSFTVTAITKQYEALKLESEGKFNELKELTVTEQIDLLDTRTEELAQQNAFLEGYIKSLESLVKEKAPIGGGRVRVSRSATPYQ